MLKERLSAVHAVRDSYLPMKIGVACLKADVIDCLRVMEECRARAGLKIGDGAQEIAAIAEALSHLSRAELLIAGAHPGLADLVRKAGLSAHYDPGEGYGDEATHPFTGGALRAA